MTDNIPSPPSLPWFSNINELDTKSSLKSFVRLADIYGPIYKTSLAGRTVVIISSVQLLDEVSDETRFQKVVQGHQEQLRHGVKDGLLTAYPGEPNWSRAHKLLMPAFGSKGIRDMFDGMHEIAGQLATKWARCGGSTRRNVTDDFMRVTLDSIALCTLGVRFNSLQDDHLHPFIHALDAYVREADARAKRPAVVTGLMGGAKYQFHTHIQYLRDFSNTLYLERKSCPTDKKDLLNAMIKGQDKETGGRLSDESIVNNMITFLLAGYETTSGALSFLFYYLCTYPAHLIKAQAEVDAVVGRGPVTVQHMQKLPYLTACLRETLRLSPTTPYFTVHPRPCGIPSQFVTIDKKYQLTERQVVLVLLSAVHRDPKVFGENALDFQPERMLEENFQKFPQNAWKPFGTGTRSCIGKAFAWQQSLLVSALLLQNFNFRHSDPGYKLHIKETLTTKRDDFYMHATLRYGLDLVDAERTLHAPQPSFGSFQPIPQGSNAVAAPSTGTRKRIAILYGSNAGTCKSLAMLLARAATSSGYTAQPSSLDSALGDLPRNMPLIIISSSYEGDPPEDAVHFVSWLQSPQAKDLKDIKYAVFGCGHSHWASTYQKIPITVDTILEEKGATRIISRGVANILSDNVSDKFDEWTDELWPAIRRLFSENETATNSQSTFYNENTTSYRPLLSRQDVEQAQVLKCEVLTTVPEPEKRHLEIQLPAGQTYRTGDYLAVLPVNSLATVKRVLERFQLPWDAQLTITVGQHTTLPTTKLVLASEILASYVELSQPASARNVLEISQSISDLAQRTMIDQLRTQSNPINGVRLSPIDLLEQFPDAKLPFSSFLAMCPPLRVRQYSISSSPMQNAEVCSLTYSVLNGPAYACLQPGSTCSTNPILGVASNYLSGLKAGDSVQVSVRPSRHAFHLPTDIENTPLIMVCAGTGIAPFRAFVQERATQIVAGRTLAPALLFIGCRSSTSDALYRADLSEWTRQGAVDIRYAFSRDPDRSVGCRYVQDRLWSDRADIVEMYKHGTKMFMCASNAVRDEVADVSKKIYVDAWQKQGFQKSEVEVEQWFSTMTQERIATDVFG